MKDLEKHLSGEDNLQKMLKESYAILKSMIDSHKNVVIFALDCDYQYLAFNQNHQHTMKQIWGVDIALGSSMLSYIKNPDDRMKAKNNFDRALQGESFIIEEEYGDSLLERRYYEDIYNPIVDEDGKTLGLTLLLTDITKRKNAEAERDKLITELQEALSKVKVLSGLIPVCSQCKKIRDDNGYWNKLESYIEKHSDASFSHGICPECSEKLYGDEDWYIEMHQNDKK